MFIPRVEETIRLHTGCLISGEGGIGKSYFIKCLEEEFKTIGKKHLCLYGKFCLTISEIDFNEIATIAQTEEFIFIFDAINEIDEQSQLDLINELKKIKDTKDLRIIITYRTHTMDMIVTFRFKYCVPVLGGYLTAHYLRRVFIRCFCSNNRYHINPNKSSKRIIL